MIFEASLISNQKPFSWNSELDCNSTHCSTLCNHSSIHACPTNLSRQEFPAGAYRTTRLPFSCSVSNPLSWILAPSLLSVAPPFWFASLHPILSVSACRQRCQRGYPMQQPACSHLRLMAGQRKEKAPQSPGERRSHGPIGLPLPYHGRVNLCELCSAPRQKQDFRRSRCLTSLLRCPTSNLQSG